MHLSTKWFASARGRVRRIPLGLWAGAAGAAGISLNLLLAPEQWTTPWLLGVSLAHVLCLVMITRHPVPTWFSYLPFFLIVAFLPEARITAFVLIAPVMTGLLAYRGHISAAAWGSALIVYAGAIDPLDGVYLPTNLLATLVWAALPMAAVLIGRTLHQLSRQRRELVSRWRLDVQQRRENLARSLHDSVATSLTSIVMRAEALNLRQDLDARVGEELRGIADQARASMSEVRGLLRVLSEDAAARPPAAEAPMLRQLGEAGNLLRAHGFHVETQVEPPEECLNADQLVILRQVLSELSTNVVKYAAPGSPVRLRLSRTETELVLSIDNHVRAGKPPEHLASGLGLPALAQLAAGAGGRLSTSSDAESWTSTLSLPLRSPHRSGLP